MHPVSFEIVAFASFVTVVQIPEEPVHWADEGVLVGSNQINCVQLPLGARVELVDSDLHLL